MRYMYGSVTVRTATVEAESEEKALEILKDIKTKNPNKVLTENRLTWGETPDRDIRIQRDGVLGDFLDLMTNLPRCSAADFIIFPEGETNLTHTIEGK